MARIFFGIIVGLGIGGAFGFVLGDLILETDEEVTWALAAIFGGFGAIYSPIAFVNEVYGHGVLSLLGYVLDLTWSSINTLAGLVVWIPACLIAGGKLKPATGDSKRSGSFVYDKNPRGGGLDTTIGNVVAGGWSAHEEIHIWQARIFGPAYLISYGVSYALNFLFYLWKMKVTGIVMGAYRRVVWEDWAYWGGSSSSNDIHWGPWIGGFFLTLLYMTFFVMIPLGIALEEVWVWVVGIVGLCVYTMIRTFLKA